MREMADSIDITTTAIDRNVNAPKNKGLVQRIGSDRCGYWALLEYRGQSETSAEMRYEDENIWPTQTMMATVYDVSAPAINQQLKRISTDNELEETAVIKQYLTTAADGRNCQGTLGEGSDINPCTLQ